MKRAALLLSSVAWVVLAFFFTWTWHVRAGQRREIVFVDGAVPDREALLRALEPSDSTRSLEVIWLDPATDGVTQVTAALAKRRGIDAVHILSHGDEGGFRIGATFVNEREARRRAAELQGWRASLTQGADLLIYGCRAARGLDGERLLRTLAELTGADVAGSDHFVGSSRSGGEWALGIRVGQIETRAAVSAEGLDAWGGWLANFTWPSSWRAIGGPPAEPGL